MEKKFNFVFITTNLINGHQYVGEHSSNNLDCKKTVNYIGSGRLFSIKKEQYGRENFKREILEFSPTKQEAFDAQEKYIRLYKTHVSYSGYNKDWTGGRCAAYFSTEHNEKISLSKKGLWEGEKNPNYEDKMLNDEEKQKRNKRLKNLTSSIEWRKHISKIKTWKKLSEEHIQSLKKADRTKWKISEEGLKNIKKANSKPKTEEHKKHLSESHKGKKLSDETKNKLSISGKNRIVSQKTKEKLSKKLKGKKRSDEAKMNYSLAKKGKLKLNSDQIREIKEKLNFMKMQNIAKEYNVQRNLIYKIKTNTYEKTNKIQNTSTSIET